MKIRALRPLVGKYGRVEEGETFDPGPSVAKSLLERGLAAKVKTPPRVGETPDGGQRGVAGPLAGSPIGAGKPSSSSGRAPAPARSTSSSRGKRRES